MLSKETRGKRKKLPIALLWVWGSLPPLWNRSRYCSVTFMTSCWSSSHIWKDSPTTLLAPEPTKTGMPESLTLDNCTAHSWRPLWELKATYRKCMPQVSHQYENTRRCGNSVDAPRSSQLSYPYPHRLFGTSCFLQSNSQMN